MNASEYADVIKAALHNLSLDLSGGDVAAVEIVGDFIGREITRDEAHRLVNEAEAFGTRPQTS